MTQVSKHHPYLMFTWTPEMSVGVKELDEQHQQLFALINDACQMAQDLHGDPARMLEIINRINNYNLYHLSTEEEYMKTLGCGTPEHFAAHESYREQSRVLLTKAQLACEKDPIGCSARVRELVKFAGDWHVGHIEHADKKYTACFNSKGLY